MNALDGNYKNTGNKPLSEVIEHAYICNILTYSEPALKDPHEIAFVVSADRGFAEYKQVMRQSTKANYSHYTKSLLGSCFKGWH